jgi:hypothetical protein
VISSNSKGNSYQKRVLFLDEVNVNSVERANMMISRAEMEVCTELRSCKSFTKFFNMPHSTICETFTSVI